MWKEDSEVGEVVARGIWLELDELDEGEGTECKQVFLRQGKWERVTEYNWVIERHAKYLNEMCSGVVKYG